MSKRTATLILLLAMIFSPVIFYLVSNDVFFAIVAGMIALIPGLLGLMAIDALS